ncbi:histidine utilization repressor [Rhodoligotrophos defluvii]|uniref:histidine utilization repressor n=1 Tax=Rhodoligotrophos defluvii TaxID=2561934 RepID=UPI0019612CCB|nr:histidine utilization repressor [Rhodoligotrophos defluvii]
MPIYQRIKSHIAEHIRRGDWPAGLKIPSENQLVAELKVSRMTINRALRELTDEGFLSRVQGVGTFVRGNPLQAGTVELRDIAEEIRSRGRAHRAIIEAQDATRATPELARLFGLAEPARLFQLVLVHCEDELPVQVEERWCNPAVLPDFLKQDFTRVTPEAYLAGATSMDEVEHTIRAVTPQARHQRLLIINPDEPCLSIERRIWSGGHVASYARLTQPGSRYLWRSRWTPVASPKGKPDNG